MKDFSGKIAVVTGGGAGMGRELALQLVAEGCHVGICDISEEYLKQAYEVCTHAAPEGVMVSAHIADVSDKASVEAWASKLSEDFETDHINILFNNAGVNGGFESFVNGDAARWGKTFDICWGGVYNTLRAFLPMLKKADEALIVNTSSISGAWASMGPGRSNSSYCAAKFAVRGFTEALIEDLAVHTPHIKCAVVMPGLIGTSITANSEKIYGGNAEDEGIKDMVAQHLVNAPTTPARAAEIIIEGIHNGKWRILVGKDAELVDKFVRESPEEAYTPAFFEKIMEEASNGADMRVSRPVSF